MRPDKTKPTAPVHVVVICFRFVAVPLLVFLYIAASIPLAVRQGAHRVTWWFDWAFDKVAELAGWDWRFWPLPKASDVPLPWKD